MSNEDFVDVIKQGFEQDKIKDKWKGEFSGRQKFSERVERRIAKGSSLGNRIAGLCIPRVMQAVAVLFFEVLDPAASMPRIEIMNPDKWPITIEEIAESSSDDEEVQEEFWYGTPAERGEEEVDPLHESARVLIAELATRVAPKPDEWSKFQTAFNYHPNIEALTKQAREKQFESDKKFRNWCVSKNLAPLSEIADRTGIKIDDLISQRYLADANRKIHREILSCCEVGHVSQAQHEYCTEKKIPEGNAQYVRGLPLFLFMIKELCER